MLTLIRQNLRRAASLTLAAFLILSTLPPAVVFAAGSLTVSGTVTNQSGGGVLNVSVYATAPGGSTTLYGPTTTSSNGAYSLGIDPGTYDIHFDPPAGSGLNPIVNTSYGVSANQTLNVQLTPLSHTLTGTLLNAAGTAQPSMQVTLVNTVTNASLRFTTDANGHYSIAAVAGTYYLANISGTATSPLGSISINNWYSGTDSRTLLFDLSSADLAKDIVLPTATVTVTVKNNTGNPVSGATVIATSNGNSLFPMVTGSTAGGYYDGYNHSATTNASGVAVITTYQATYGPGTICTTISGNQLCNSATVTVGGSGGSLTLQQPSTFTLSGTLQNAAGTPQPSMQVTLSPTTGSGSLRFTTDSNGHYSVPANPGTYYLANISGTATSPLGSISINNWYSGTDSRTLQFNLTSADLAQDITLPTATLAVTVKDSAGNTLSGLTVSATSNGNSLFPMVTGSTAGGYYDGYNHSATTNASGVASVAAYQTTYGAGTICATIGGNQTCNTTPVTVASSGAMFTLQQPPTHVLSGTLRNSNGTAQPSMQVTLSPTAGSGSLRFTTDASGNYSIPANTGTYYLANISGTATSPLGSISINNWYSGTDSRTLLFDLSSADLAKDITLPIASLTVTVKDGYGNPVSGAAVIATSNGNSLFPLVTGSTAGGYYDGYNHSGKTNASGTATITTYQATYGAGTVCTTLSGNQLCNTAPVTLGSTGATLLFQAAPQAPPAPTGLTASSPTSTAPALSWGVVSVASSYNIYRGGVKIGSTTATTFTDSSLTVTGTYAYNVTAVSALNVESSTSNTVSVVFYGPGPVVTNTQVSPSTISVNQTATLSANVSDANASVTSAEYFEGADPGQGHGTSMSIVAGVAAATLPSTLSVGQHTFTVRALDSLGNWTTGTLPTATLTVTLPVFSGKVTNFANSGVSGVRVDVVSQSDHSNIIATTNTDNSGNYSVSISTPGTYDVIYTPSDITNQPLTKTGINMTTSMSLNVQLPAVQHTISGTITKSDGTPAPYLSLKLCLTSNSSICVTASNDTATGRYNATVNAGVYNATQLAGSSTQPLGTVVIQPYSSAFTLDATGGNVTQDLQLPVGSLSVTAKDSYGNPASGASITVYDAYAAFPIAAGSTTTYVNVATHQSIANSLGSAVVGDIATTYSPGSICANINSHVTCNSASVTVASNGTTNVLLQATPQAPPAPKGLTAGSPTSVAPALNWSPASGASSYNIYRNGTKIGSVTGTTFTDASLTVNGTYTYTVTAVSALSLESTASAAVTVVFTQVPIVTNVQLTPGTVSVNQTATLSASVTSANATVAAAEYFEGADPGQGNGTPMNIVAGTASATLPSTLSVGQHTFTVRAKDSLGNWTASPLPSATLTVTLPILNGRVVNNANDGLSGVRVDIVSQSDHTNIVATTSTDSNGSYTATANTPGTYDVIYTPSDTHYEQVIKTGINLMTSNTLDVVMALRPTTFSGTLTDENSAPIVGATISLRNAGGQTASGTTGQNGTFTVTVNPSTYTVTISGTKAASPDAFIPSGFTLTGGSFDLTNNIGGVPFMVRAATVSLTTNSSLTSLAVGSVALSIGTSTSTTLYTGSDTYAGSVTYNVISDGYGRASVVMLEGTTYAVTAVPPTNSGVLTTAFPQVGPITADPPTRELDMNADIRDYSGRVTDGTEIAGLTGVTVQLSGANGTFQTTTDSSGHFDIQVAAGTYTLSISGNASSGASMPNTYSLSGYNVDLTGGSPAPAVFPIRTAKVTVTAKTPFGATLDGVGVSLTNNTGNVTVGNYLFSGSASSSGTTVNGSVDLYVLDDLTYNTKAVPAGGGYITTNSSSPSPIVEGDTAWDIVLNRELHEFKGVVTDRSGQLVSGATVRLDGNEPDQHYSMATASDGAFDLFVAPNSAYSLQVSGTQAASTNAFLPDNYALSKTVAVTSDVTNNIAINAADLQLVARDDRMNLIDGVGIGFSSNGSQNGFAASTSNVSRTTANGGQAEVRILVGTTYAITATPPANLGYINTTFTGTSPIVQDSQIILEFQNHIPLAPSCLNVPSPTRQAPVLTWCAVTNADHYLIYRDGVQIQKTTSTTFTDASLTADGAYSYRVAAVSADGYQGPLSDPAGAIYDTTAPSLQYSLSAEPNATGWNHTPVTITYTCADALGGVASCPAPQTESVDGIYDLSATAVDGAGNTTTVTPEIKLDQTAPTITYAIAPAPNNSGWNNSDVTVTFSCTDALSGVAACSAPVTISTEGANQQVTGTVTDNAGNTASVTATISLDKTAPVISYSLSPAPNGNGWNNGPVTITYTCSDALSGIANCPAAQAESIDGIYDLSATAIDNAGNSTTITPEIKIDQTAPTISYTLSPTPNANGWNNGDVTVTFNCADATSGIAACSDPVTMSTESANQQITGTATDNAGNTASVTATISLDKTGPTLSYDLSAAPNANGWNNAPVTITYHCSDALSGIATCPPSQTISDDGVHFITATATDNADNATTVNLTIKIDQTQPTISYTLSPTPNANGWNNSNTTVTFSCQDAASGVQSCTPPQTVATEGASQTVTGTAVDYAGNVTNITATVSVDKTAPVVTGISWSANPLVQGQSTTISATATDNLSQVGSMYYTMNGGVPQQLTFDSASGTWKATFGATLAVNTYNIMVYAVDNAGNTSAQKPDVLAVYSPTSGSLSGHAWIMPTATDSMPIALDTSSHPAALVLGFSSQHGATTSVDAHYIVKNNQDEFDFSSTTVDWVVIPDSTHASLLVHGILTIYQGGVKTTLNDETMRLDVVLGANGTADQINMRMWNPLLDPNSVPPTYQVNDDDLPSHSQLVIR